MKTIIDYIRCPLHRHTFSVEAVRRWVEDHCEGSVLNLFAGITRLNVDEIRNDQDSRADADFHLDALQFLNSWTGGQFDTILLNPTGAYYSNLRLHKSIGLLALLKDALIKHLKPAGKVITFGYYTVAMGENRGFKLEKIGLFSHGGAIHDTIASVERFQF